MGLKGVEWEETRSSRIPKMFKGPAAETHNALDDARSQAQMFERMLRHAQERQQESG
jgi:inhibitor of KinA sporulation pathway (predicted exonuclease)